MKARSAGPLPAGYRTATVDGRRIVIYAGDRQVGAIPVPYGATPEQMTAAQTEAAAFAQKHATEALPTQGGPPLPPGYRTATADGRAIVIYCGDEQIAEVVAPADASHEQLVELEAQARAVALKHAAPAQAEAAQAAQEQAARDVANAEAKVKDAAKTSTVRTTKATKKAKRAGGK